ncbi:MAG TPA: phage tail tape measure protein [Pseudonocardiaceae bacterium]
MTATRTVRVRFDGDARGLRQAANDGEQAVSGWSKGVSRAGAAAAAAAAAAGAAVAAAFGAAAMQSLRDGQEKALSAAQVGAPPELAAAMGRAAGDAYTSGFGDSVGDASRALRDAWLQGLIPEDATEDAMARVAEKVLSTSTLLEEDSKRVTAAVGTMYKAGLVKDVDEAFDLITRAQQQGLNKQGDLLDSVVEYAVQFQRLGVSAPVGMGLISQAMRAGARDTDFAADALKEFAIRAIDGSTTTAAGFKALGLDAKKMADDVAAGGDRSAAALDAVLDGLRAVEDPVKRNAAAVQLFGTKAEDLGDALFAMDVDTAAAELGNLAGATQKAADTMSGDALSKIRQFGRSLKQDVTDQVNAAIPRIAAMAKPFVEDVEPAARSLGGFFRSDLGPGIQAFYDNYLSGLVTAWNRVRDTVKNNEGGLRDLWAAIKPVVDVITGYLIPAIGWLAGQALQQLGRQIELVIVGLSLLGTGARAMKDLAVAAFTAVTSAVLSFVGTVVNGAATAFGWIPGIGDKLRTAAAEFNQFANNVNQALERIRDRHVNVVVNTVGGPAIQQYVNGVPVGQARRATGGPVSAGRSYLVNETGLPELLTMGGRQYLLMGDQGGHVTPASEVGGGPQVIELHVHVGDEVTRVVRHEIGEANRGLKRTVLAGAVA